MPWDVRPARISDIERIQFIDSTGLTSRVYERWYKDRIKKYPTLFWVAYLTEAPMSDPNVLDPPGTVVSFGNGVPWERFAARDHPAFSDLQDCGFLSRGVTLLPYRRQGMMRRIVENIMVGFCEMGIDTYLYSNFRKSNNLSTWFHLGRPGYSKGLGFEIVPERCVPNAYKTGVLTPDDAFMVTVRKPMSCDQL